MLIGVVLPMLSNTTMSSVLEDPGREVVTDQDGRFSFDYPEGQNVTLAIAPRGYYPTQTPTGEEYSKQTVSAPLC